MNSVRLVWVCLSCTCWTRRLQRATENWQGELKRPNMSATSSSSQLALLESALRVVNPSAAFSARSVGLGVASANLRRGSSQVTDGSATPAELLHRILMSEMESSEADSMDWREMRARLVAQEQAQKQEEGSKEGSDSSSGYAFASPLIEQGSVILGGTRQDYGFALRQQYFHKTVCLLIQHDRFFTKGIILNRPTAYEIEGFRVWFGGDVAHGGMFRGMSQSKGEREIVCLHTLEGNMTELLSVPIIKGVAYTDFEDAKDLIRQGRARQSDFVLFVGYCGWAPGQLQGEVDRDSWFLASTDSGTLLKELLRQGRELPAPGQGLPPDNGISTWDTLMQRIGFLEDVERSRGSLSDRMLSEWCRTRLMPAQSKNEENASSISKNSTMVIPKGAVLRAGSLSDKGLLEDQFLHKSLVLIVDSVQQLPEKVLLAVVLNRPTSDAVQLTIGDNLRRHISIGGTQLLPGLADGNGLMWLGQTEKLKPLSVGTEVGNSGLSRCDIEDVVESIKAGTTVLADYLLIKGLVVFLESDLTSMIEKGEFTVLQDARRVWPQVFELQEVSDEPAAARGASLSDGTSVWWAAGLFEKKMGDRSLQADGTAGASAEGQGRVFDTELPAVQSSELADEALAEWLKVMAGHRAEDEAE